MGKDVRKAKIIINYGDSVNVSETSTFEEVFQVISDSIENENNSIKVKVEYEDDTKGEFEPGGDDEDEEEEDEEDEEDEEEDEEDEDEDDEDISSLFV